MRLRSLSFSLISHFLHKWQLQRRITDLRRFSFFIVKVLPFGFCVNSVRLRASRLRRVGEPVYRSKSVGLLAVRGHSAATRRTDAVGQVFLPKERCPPRLLSMLVCGCPKLLILDGEPSRTRTCDPLVKSQLLYQLSYRPIYMRRAR